MTTSATSQTVSSKGLELSVMLSIVFLSIGSLIVISYGAAEEPFLAYRRIDAVLQVVVATALLAWWAATALAVLVLVGTGRLSREWLLGLIWIGLCLFFTSFCPLGYLSDLERFVLPR